MRLNVPVFFIKYILHDHQQRKLIWKVWKWEWTMIPIKCQILRLIIPSIYSSCDVACYVYQLF